MLAKNQKKVQSKDTTASNVPVTSQISLPTTLVAKEKKNGGKTYRGKGPQENEHGFGFEIQLFMLTSLNIFGMNTEPFYIASGMKQANVLDDVVLFYRDARSEKFSCMLLQCKHSRQPKTIEGGNLKSETDNFSLVKYFESYKEVNKWNDDNLFGPINVRRHKCVIKYVVVCSNNGIDSSLIGLNKITEIKKCPLKNIFQAGNLNEIKFYMFSKPFLNKIIGSDSEDFSERLIFALNFPSLDIINSNLPVRLHEIKNKLHNPELCLDNYRGWLFNRLVRVIDPEQCQFLEREEIGGYLDRLLVSEQRLIYTTLTYRLTDESIFQQIIPFNTFNKLDNLLQDGKTSVICCYSSNEQPVRWTTAQIYLFLIQSKMVPIDEVLIVDFDEVIKKKDDLTLLASQNRMYIIIETATSISPCPVEQFSAMDNSLSKLILISPCHQTNEHCIECPPLEYWSFREFQTKMISLPYGTEIYFHDFMESIENTKKRSELLNANVVKHLLSNQTIAIKHPRLSMASVINSFPHISRTLRLHNRVNIQKIITKQSETDKNEFFIFVCHQNESEVIKLEDKSNIKLINNPSQEEIQRVIDTLNNFAYIHLIEISNPDGIWRSTHVNSPSAKSSIRSYIDTKSWKLIDDHKFSLVHRITVLVAEPGMGKSYFVRWLMSSKEPCIYTENSSTVPPKFVWKICVDLRDFEELFTKLIQLHSLEHAAKFLATTFDGIEYDKQLCEHFLLGFLKELSDDHALIIVFDGFDEISESAQQNCIKLVELLNTSTALMRMIITTRKHTLWRLTESFFIPQYDFMPITKSQQIDYLEKYWNGLRGKAEQFIERLNRSINDRVENLLGTPLLCQIIAEAFAPVDNEEFKNEVNNNDGNSTILNVFELYDKFIERKYAIYLEKLHLEKSSPFSKCMFDHFMHVHQRAALYYLRPDIYHLWFETEENPLTERFLEIIHGAGIAESTDNQTSLHFIHRTFAEYFEAKLYISILSASTRKINQLVRDCKQHMTYAMLCPEYQVAKLFLDSYFDSTESSLFHEQWASIKNSWLFVPIPKIDKQSNEWKFSPPLFNARTDEKIENVDSNYSNLFSAWSKTFPLADNLQKLTSFAEFYNRTNCERAIKQIDSETEYNTHLQIANSLCHHLFLLPKSDRQHITREIHEKVLKEDSSDESFELRVWLQLYDYVDKNVNLLDTLEPDDLFLDHAWLFNTVFPRLFSCDRNREEIVEAYELTSTPCVADLLLCDAKDDDENIAYKMEQIDQLETEMYRVYSKPFGKIKRMDEADRRNILDCDNLMSLREPLDESKLTLVPGFAGVQQTVLDRNQLIVELNRLMKDRKENQRHFIKSFFGIQDTCDLDTYLRQVEDKIVKSVEDICEGGSYSSQLYTLHGFFKSHFEIYLAHLCDELCLFIPGMKDRLLYLGEYHMNDPMLYIYLENLVPKLLATLAWAFPSKQMFVHIDIQATLDFLSDLCDHGMYCGPFLLEWYKGIIKLIQRCLDQFSSPNPPHSYTFKSVCGLLSSFVRTANLAVVADIDERKFVLHQTTELKLFVAEIMTNNGKQWQNISTEIRKLLRNDGKQRQNIQIKIPKSPHYNIKQRQTTSWMWAESESETESD